MNMPSESTLSFNANTGSFRSQSAAELIERLQCVLSVVRQESWLPLALRSYITEEVGSVCGLLDYEGNITGTACDQLRLLASTCSSYETSPLRSKSLRLIEKMMHELDSSEQVA